MDTSKDILTFLPLTEVTYFILLSLAPKAKHGYAIMKDVSTLSSGRVALSTGTLYGALQRLLELGWISRASELEMNLNGRQRKTYHLTDLGHQILGAEVKRLNSLVIAARLPTMGSNQ